MEQPIVNPPNPYVGTLRIFPGTMVKISGRPRPNAARFAINFQTGPSLNPRDDLALHLSPVFTPPRIIRNSLQRGAWGLEEAWGNGTILSPHSPFEIIILAEPDQFKIAVNGGHYCEFRHRIPYQEITHLTIDGDVIVDRITITSIPYQQPQHQPQQPAYQPSAPYSASSSMPMAPVYPTLPTSSGAYPPSSMYPNPSMPPGPMPTGASYMAGGSGYPQIPHVPGGGGPSPYPSTNVGPYPPPMGGGPSPTGAGYQGGYPSHQPHPQQPHHQQQQQQPGHSSLPFGLGGKTLGSLAGLGLAGAAGAAILSAANPLKLAKKIAKPKGFKHKGWGRSSSSSSSGSNSSRSSFSSNSS